MRTLSRPMFNMGGPIKQGIMNGIREPKKDGGAAAGLVGDQRYPKTSGREHHWAFMPWLLGAGATALRSAPAAYRGWKGAKWLTPGKLGKWGRFKDMMSPSARFKNVTTPKGHPGSSFKYEPAPLSWKEILKSPEKWGAAIGENPVTAFTVGSAIPQAGAAAYKGIKAAPGGAWGLAKKYAAAVVPGDQGHWWKEKEAPTGVPLNPNLQKLLAAVDTPEKEPKKLSEAERKAFAKSQREKRVNKYLDMMGYDRSKKMAIADALIDASKIVSERGTLDPKNITRELINPIIQATSKRLDKPGQIREAVGLMATKAEIEKDLSKETDALKTQLTKLQIQGAEQTLAKSASFEAGMMEFLSARKDKVNKETLEKFARLLADKHGDPFKKVTADEVATTNGIYMIEGNIFRVIDGIEKQIV